MVTAHRTWILKAGLAIGLALGTVHAQPFLQELFGQHALDAQNVLCNEVPYLASYASAIERTAVFDDTSCHIVQEDSWTSILFEINRVAGRTRTELIQPWTPIEGLPEQLSIHQALYIREPLAHFVTLVAVEGLEFSVAVTDTGLTSVLRQRARTLDALRQEEPKEPTASSRARLEGTPLIRQSPLAVLLGNNAFEYPQAGLRAARTVFEVPTEDGYSQLLALFHSAAVAEVGVIGAARYPVVELARQIGGVLVTDAQTARAWRALEAGESRTISAYRRGEMFRRGSHPAKSHALYGVLPALFEALRRMNVSGSREVPPLSMPEPADRSVPGARVTIEWGESYTSGFRYVPATNRYQWIRQGAQGVDLDGAPISVSAVLLAYTQTERLPTESASELRSPSVIDTEFALDVNVRRGRGTLLLNGQRFEGCWSGDRDLTFGISGRGTVHLEALPSKWIAFIPSHSVVHHEPYRPPRHAPTCAME